MIERKQASRSGGKEEGEISTNLQTETGLAPVPPLGVVAVRRGSLAFCLLSLLVSNIGRGEERGRKKKKKKKNLSSPLKIAKQNRLRYFRDQGGCLLDGVAGPQTNPLRDGTVLALGFSKLLLGAETLVALYGHFS